MKKSTFVRLLSCIMAILMLSGTMLMTACNNTPEVPETEPPADTTSAPEPTSAPETTLAPETEPVTEPITEPTEEKGCGGMISLSILALIPAAVLIIKKKEDK